MSTAHDMPVTLLPSPEHAPLLRLVPESSEPLDFDNAVRRLRPRLHRYAERRLGDSHEAEELVREALLRAYSHRPQLLTEDALAAWTTVVTGRLVIDRLRVRGRSTSVPEVPEGNRTVRDTADVVVARDEACTALDAVLAEIKGLEADGRTSDPRYEELLIEHHYVHHVLRIPAQDWPDPVRRAFAHINQSIYVPMQGPSELGASGKLLDWDRTADLHRVEVPTLVIGGQHDTMDPAHLEEMARTLAHGTYLHCPNGSHLSMYDDQQTYMQGLLEFLTADVQRQGPS